MIRSRVNRIVKQSLNVCVGRSNLYLLISNTSLAQIKTARKLFVLNVLEITMNKSLVKNSKNGKMIFPNLCKSSKKLKR